MPKVAQTNQQKAPLNKRDDRSKSYERRRRMMFLRRTVLMSVLILGVGGGWLAWERGYLVEAQSFAMSVFEQVPKAEALKVQVVKVEGGGFEAQAQILALTQGLKGTPILEVPLANLREDIMAMGWVADASVLRVLPDTIRVRITERAPYAVWQKGGVLQVIDRHGVVMTQSHMETYAHLPLIVGDGAPGALSDLLVVMEREPAILARVHAFVRVGDRRWDLRFDNGIEVMLPAQGTHLAIRRLSELERQNAILSRDIAVLDLRLPDRMTVRPRAATAHLEPAAQEDL